MLDSRIHFLITYFILTVVCVLSGVGVIFLQHYWTPRDPPAANTTSFYPHYTVSSDSISHQEYQFQEAFLKWATVATSIISFIGSVLIIIHFLVGTKQFARSIQTKLIVYWCCADIIRGMNF
jgi:hypothetical protein